MSLPYSVEVYFAVMAAYNAAWLPVAVLAVLLMMAALGLAVSPLPGRAAASARIVGGLLAAAWIWVGAVHQLRHMAALDFMAPYYGGAWIAEGGLIALTCVVLGRVRFRLGGDVRGWTGLALALFGLLGYPLAVLSLGHGWQAVPLAGMAPAPTVILTAGILAAARDRPPWYLFVLPIGWAGVAAVSAYLLGFALDYTVTAAILAATVLAAMGPRMTKS